MLETSGGHSLERDSRMNGLIHPTLQVHQFIFLSNPTCIANMIRTGLAMHVLEIMINDMQQGDVEVGVYDATNTTLERRAELIKTCRAVGLKQDDVCRLMIGRRRLNLCLLSRCVTTQRLLSTTFVKQSLHHRIMWENVYSHKQHDLLTIHRAG